MMKSIFAAIARVVAAMSQTASRWIKKAGRWVLETLPGGGGAAVVPSPDVAIATAEAAIDAADIKRVAGVLAQGRIPTASELHGVRDHDLAWLKVLNRRQLCRVMAADDKLVLAHVTSKDQIPGVVASDTRSVAAIAKAQAMSQMPAPTARGRRAEVERMIQELDGGDPAHAWAPAI